MKPFVDSTVVGSSAIALSILLCASGAIAFFKKDQRSFTILALLSIVWALLTGYYSVSKSDETLPGLSGFLMIYIGGLLRSGSVNFTERKGRGVSYIEQYSFWLLLVTIGVLGADIKSFFRLQSDEDIKIIFATFISMCGFISIISACASRFSSHPTFSFYRVIVSLYAIIDVAYSIYELIYKPKVMPIELAYVFSLLKIVFTETLIFLMAYGKFSLEEKKRPFRTLALRQGLGSTDL